METNNQHPTAEQYTECLQEIGTRFLDVFKKRSFSLPLHIQIVCGLLSVEDLEKLLSTKPYLANAHDDHGRVLLMLHWHTVYHEVLLRHGADPSACDANGNSVLMYQRRNRELVRRLLKAGADVNARNHDGVALIGMALEEGLPIQPLLDAGAVWLPVPRDKKDKIFLNCLEGEDTDILSRIVSDNPPSDDAYHYAMVWSGCHCQKKFDWLERLGKLYTRTTRSVFTERELEIFEKAIALRKCDKDSHEFKMLIANMGKCLDEPSMLNQCVAQIPSLLTGVHNLETFSILLKMTAQRGKAVASNLDGTRCLARLLLDEYENAISPEGAAEKHLQDIFQSLGFEMDGGAGIREAFPNVDMLGDVNAFRLRCYHINDIQLLANTIFSQFRRITHWSYESLNSQNNRNWFRLAFTRMYDLISR